MSAPGTKTLKIIHASLEVFDTDGQAVSDLRKIVGLKPHILCGTESGTDHRQDLMQDVLEKEGYVSYFPGPNTDGWIAVRAKLAGHGFRCSYRKVWGNGKSHHDPHPYAEKGVVTFSFDHEQLGHVGIVGGGHYLTKGRWPEQAQQDHPGDPVDHVEANKKLAWAMADAAIVQSEGPDAIAFLTADTNLIDHFKDVWYGKPITTCWDELKKWPDTGHGNIDVVASVDADTRVRCSRADVLDDKELRLATDHFLVTTEYVVRKLR